MKSIQIFIALLLAGSLTTISRAQNTYFLPGDAFFSTSLSREMIKKWSENLTGEFELKYSRFDGHFYPAGNIGYTNLRVTGIDANLRKAVAEAYWRYSSEEAPLFRMDSDDPKDMVQINSVVALIYNSEFSGTLGLKFNEDWQEQGLGEYGGLFQTAKPVVEDWKLGPKVPPLRLVNVIDPIAHLNRIDGVPYREINTPLFVRAANIKIFFVGFAYQKDLTAEQRCPNLQRIYEADDDFIQYVSVDSSGFTSFTFTKTEGWQKERVAIPLESSNSWIPKEAEQDVAPNGP